MSIPTFIEYDATLVSHALRHWYWKIGDPEDPDFDGGRERPVVDVLAATAFGDVVIWDDYDTRVLQTSRCDYDYGNTPLEKAEEFMGNYEFRQKYIYFNDAQFAEQIAETAGGLAPNQCYAPIIYHAAGGSYSDPNNFAVTDIDQHLALSGIIFHLRERLPDREWDFVNKVIGERSRINQLLRDAYPIIARTPNKP